MKQVVLVALSILNILSWNVRNISLDEPLFYLPLITIVISVIFAFPLIRKKHIQVRILHLFLIGILLFNAPIYLIAIFYNPVEIMSVLLDCNITIDSFIKSNVLLGISFPLIILGYFIPKRFEGRDKKIELTRKKIELIPILIISFVLLFFSVLVTGLRIGSLYIGTSSYYYILLVRFVSIASCIYAFNAYNKYRSNKEVAFFTYVSENYLYCILLILFAIYLLIGGDRGPVLVVLLIFFGGFILSNNMLLKIRTVLFLMLFLIAFVCILRFVENIRVAGKDEVFSVENIQNVESSDDLFIGSQRCTCLAIEGINNGIYEHTLGLFTIESIVGSIPFIGSRFFELCEIPFLLRGGSALLLSVQHYGFDPPSGLGTTYLADLYIEFGLLGIILFSILFGILVKYFDLICTSGESSNYYIFMLICFSIGYSIYTARSTLFTFFVNYIHTLIVYLTYRCVFTVIKKALFYEQK